MIPDVADLFVKPGERILPAWNRLVQFTEESGVHFGPGVKVQYIPGAGIHVTAERDSSPWAHPWKTGSLSLENTIYVRAGTVNGKIPWVTKDYRLDDIVKETGEFASIQTVPKDKGHSLIAVGVNIHANDLETAELSAEPTFEELQMREIADYPNGFGSGGVKPDADGWAWYPIAIIFWKEKLIERRFQIVYHNLIDAIVQGGENKDEERHFFFAAG